uniref:Peptide-methionine (R)-S-oxide reductase n=1 Tax=Trichuris muris TaxID=70415 RepID=A0A5S6QRY2_TRIMR
MTIAKLRRCVKIACRSLNFASRLMTSSNAAGSSPTNGGLGKTDKVCQLTQEEWRHRLTPEQFEVTRNSSTERPFSSHLCNFDEEGTYSCVCCGSILFSSKSKFHSGCGWPAFSEAFNEGNIEKRPDYSHNMMRTEVVCKTCHAHLGHVFDDGPKPSGVRYCINGVAMNFIPKQQSTADKKA